MIQRKQTLFLLAAATALLVAVFMNTATKPMLVLLAVAAALCLTDIFLFKRRKLQALLTLPVMLLIVAWYILLATGAQGDSVYVWPNALPLLALLFTFLARKGILHDEKLVRSLDRIR